ncbi:MAG TPA: glycosyltransferase family A protein, partial [Dehalococcoidia bacterium]|nr:glycosyltransferase family A protein [Dehalococcoidia bacterium]
MLNSIAETVAKVAHHRCEVIIVDNASTDDTAGIAEHAGAKVVSEPRKGVSYARQRGLEEAKTPVLIGSDGDTVVPPTWVDSHLSKYDDPGVVGVTGRFRFDHVHPLFHGYKACASVVQSAFRLLRAIGAVEK